MLIQDTHPVIVIPAFQPTDSLLKLISELLKNPNLHIILVNDGSSVIYNILFEKLSVLERVIVLRHAINLGKGQALKTAFNYFLIHYTSSVGVVTADADGQHLVADIQLIIDEFKRDPKSLCLGVRSFESGVPFRSWLGNQLTRAIFRFLVGCSLQDTQTGLRGIPRECIAELLGVSATGYEFELEMLVRIRSRKISIKEFPITTVYQDNNKSSHFNPGLDSLKISFVFLRFSMLSIASATLDFGVFSFSYLATDNILGSIIAGRLIAGTFNFILGKTFVFQSKGGFAKETFKYILLATLLMSVSYGLVTSMVVFLGVSVYASKVIAETVLFLVSFAAQELLVFSGPKQKYRPNS